MDWWTSVLGTSVSPDDFNSQKRLRSLAGWTVNGSHDSLHWLKAPVLGAKNRTGVGERII